MAVSGNHYAGVGQVRSLLGGLLLAAAAWAGAASAAVEVPVIENAGYGLCVSEANYAMTLGRMVMVFKRPRAEVEDDPNLPPYLRDMAADFFQDQAAGRAKTYVHFAMRRFQDCLAAQKVRIEADSMQTFACLARMDIPYFFFVLQRMGETKEAATARIESSLAAWHYPDGLVGLVAEPAWGLRDEDELKTMQAFLFNSCLLPPEQVSHYYGVTPPREVMPGAASGSGRK